ncbi:ACP S-malonyltransferase [Streptomyces sp. NPDC086023]|uniref:ACP S-malonyltransferase n=1 Tax=Streptomyces sp. NPDC086023 TaxID=3365746 RepID=UPI0037D02B0B
MTRTAFLFPGQGARRAGMGRDLLAGRPELADRYYLEADRLLGIPLSWACLHGPDGPLREAPVSQPAVLLTSLVTLDVLRSRGAEPDVVVGHSLGAYTALVAAGALDWTDALWLVRLRGELVAAADDRVPGRMAALWGLPLAAAGRLCAEARRATGETVETANDGEGGRVVVSGQLGAVAHVLDTARAAGIRATGLSVGAALHSSLMRETEAEFGEALAATEFRDPVVPLVCGSTGEFLTTGAAARESLRGELSRPVRWAAAADRMAALGVSRYVEVGPGRTLGGLLRRLDPKARVHATGTAAQLSLTTAALAA